MSKKLVVVVALLLGIPAMAMDVMMKETPQDENKVKIFLQDEQNPESTYEVEVPVRLAKLIGLIMDDLLGDYSHVKNVGFPLINVTLQTWWLIEDQLERVYGIVHDVGTAYQLKREIYSAYDQLDSKSLSELIRAADYLEMPLLLEIVCDVVNKGALDKLSFEDIASLPGDMRYRIILTKLLMPVFVDRIVRVWEIGLFSRVRYMDDAQAQAVWKLLQRIAQHDGEIDKQKCWQEIESILMEGSLSSSGSSVNDSNNYNTIE